MKNWVQNSKFSQRLKVAPTPLSVTKRNNSTGFNSILKSLTPLRVATYSIISCSKFAAVRAIGLYPVLSKLRLKPSVLRWVIIELVCGLSGGVDSSVVAILIHKAIGDQLACIFVDNGVLRDGEREQVVKTFKGQFHLDFHLADAADQFLDRLKGVTEPEEKRIHIGHEFIDVFKEKAKELKGLKFLAQGTLYPDIIESRSAFGGPSSTIKSHHNVGGLPEDLGFELVEPLKYLFKDEVRNLGRELGLPEEIIQRQPFPGPGLAIRIIGEVTRERLKMLREADAIVQEEVRKLDSHKNIWQSFAVLLPVRSVGVMGDKRTYENACALRIVESTDGMTAKWFPLPSDTLNRISNRICNEVHGINRVVLDISSKPPSTIEWE